MRTFHLVTSALLGFGWPTIVAAQGAPPPPAPASATQPSGRTEQPKTKQQDATALSTDMAATLRKAGFTDLQIMPNSVFVRGKDKAGHPVAMVLNPGSMTEMVTLDPHSGSSAGGNGAATLTGSATFATVLPSEKLASRIIGTDVTNKSGDVLGTIRDIAIDHGGVNAYVLSVGGLLGIGEHFAAVTPTAITLSFDKGSGHYKAMMDATSTQMKAAPEFKYGDLDEATK